MKTIEDLVASLGRFAVGLAIGIALTSAYVLVTAPPGEAEPSAARMAVESVRATSTESPPAADDAGPTGRLHVYGRGAQRV